jgi:dephospho-CoA kinase
MLKVALTGGIACGKSLVASILRERGFPVCEADTLARDVVRPGMPAHDEILRVFGGEYLLPGGELDRVRLGELVFADEDARARLNAIVHPPVRSLWETWLGAQPESVKAAVVVIPLLFEFGSQSGWHAIVCVTAQPDIQLRRLQARGLSDEAAARRMRAQWTNEDKERHSDYVIANNGAVEALTARTEGVFRAILEKTYGRAI